MTISMATIIALALLVATVSGESNRMDETLVMPALGRTFTLGMLYNARNDAIIPGRSAVHMLTLTSSPPRVPKLEESELV